MDKASLDEEAFIVIDNKSSGIIFWTIVRRAKWKNCPIPPRQYGRVKKNTGIGFQEKNLITVGWPENMLAIII